MFTEPIRSPRQICKLCLSHRSGYRNQFGRWVSRPDHDVCVRCWEHLQDVQRSRRLDNQSRIG